MLAYQGGVEKQSIVWRVPLELLSLPRYKQDGVIHKDVPAKLHFEDDEIALYLSTETIGSCVCVKIKKTEITW